MKRYVYLPIGKASREVAPRILLSCELLRSDIAVGIGFSLSLFAGRHRVCEIHPAIWLGQWNASLDDVIAA